MCINYWFVLLFSYNLKTDLVFILLLPVWQSELVGLGQNKVNFWTSVQCSCCIRCELNPLLDFLVDELKSIIFHQYSNIKQVPLWHCNHQTYRAPSAVNIETNNYVKSQNAYNADVVMLFIVLHKHNIMTWQDLLVTGFNSYGFHALKKTLILTCWACKTLCKTNKHRKTCWAVTILPNLCWKLFVDVFLDTFNEDHKIHPSTRIRHPSVTANRSQFPIVMTAFKKPMS